MTTLIAAILFCLIPAIAAAQSNPLATLPPESVVAVVDGVPIRLNEVDAFSHTKDPKKLFQLNQQLFTLREEALSALVGERLLAREATQGGDIGRRLCRESPDRQGRQEGCRDAGRRCVAAQRRDRPGQAASARQSST